MPPAIHAIVSLSPPRDTAFLTASSKSSDSRKAISELRYETPETTHQSGIRTYIVETAVKVINEAFLYFSSYEILIFPFAGKENREGRCLSSFYTFGVIVSNSGASCRVFEEQLQWNRRQSLWGSLSWRSHYPSCCTARSAKKIASDRMPHHIPRRVPSPEGSESFCVIAFF